MHPNVNLSSLRLRALIASVVVVVGLSVAYSFNASRIMLDSGIAEAEANAKQISELLNLTTAPYASLGGLPTLEDFLDGMFVNNNETRLLYIVIRSDNGEQLLKAGKIPVPLPEPDEDVREAVKRGTVHVRNNILLRGNRVGTLNFGVSTQHVLETQRTLQREGLIISGSIAVLVLVSVLAASLTVSRRIGRLIEASQQIAGGNYDAVRADDRGKDEISNLASNFNAMAEGISRHIREVQESRRVLEEFNAKLEDMVALRTQQYEAKNEELASTIENLQLTRESLVRSEKLAGLGAIVAGVAHELNTPIGNALTVSTAHSENTRVFTKEMESGLKRSSLQGYIENSVLAIELIQRNLERAGELVQSFKQVAVDQTSEQKRLFNLKESVNENMLMLRPMLKKTPYQVEINIPDKLQMNSYPGPLGQVITNFVNNTVLHGFDKRDHGVIRISAETVSDSVLKLVYQDDGHGISSQNLGRIFDPFFTTRLGQGGSGLGLNIVFNIVTKLLGGTINADSAPEQGVTFTLLLPIEAPAPADNNNES